MKMTPSRFAAIVGMLMLACIPTTLLRADTLRIAVSITNPIKKTLKIAQYNLDGSLVGDLVTLTNTDDNPIEFALRDLTHHKGNLYCVFGTFDSKILHLNPGRTQMFDHPGWSYVNASHYGAITSHGDHLYAADMWTANGGEDTGLIRFTFDPAKQGTIIARFTDTASIADVTATASGQLIIIDEFGRLLCMNNAKNENAARLSVVDPEPLSHIPNTNYHVTTATAFGDGTVVYGTMQGAVVVQQPQGGYETHTFEGIINDIDQIGSTDSVVVCETRSGMFHILDTKRGSRIKVRYADPMESTSVFACIYTDEHPEPMGPPQPKPVPNSPSQPKSGSKKPGKGVVTLQ